MTSTYSTVLAQDPWPSTKLEREVIGFSNLDITATMFRDWMLPPEMFRDEPDQLPSSSSSDVLRLCRILASAEILARVWASGAEERDLAWAGEAAAHYLNMSPEDFVQVVGQLRSGIESREAFTAVAPPEQVDVRNLEEQACDRLKIAVSRTASGSRVADMLRAAQD